jgi:hypothetical protein
MLSPGAAVSIDVCHKMRMRADIRHAVVMLALIPHFEKEINY